jgi:hypothetical protein
MKRSGSGFALNLLILMVLAGIAWSQTAAPPSQKYGTPAIPKKSPLAPYAGTWTASLAGRPFVTLQLTLKGEQLSGSLQHPKNINTNDSGEVTNFSDDFATATLQNAAVTGDGLLLTMKDDSNQEVNKFAMLLNGGNTASLKMLAMNMPPGMAKPKPWKLTRASTGPSAAAQR